jgi:hypothetical protein
VVAVEDTLIFASGSKMHLPNGSHIYVGPNGYVYPQGTGNSNIITIGGIEYWRSSDGPISGTTILDVSYTEISVSHKNGKTTVRWSTASETNNDYFIVEESTNGVDFYEVGRVKGAGNSHNLKHYKFELRRNPDETHYYRLTQVDFDGSKSISAVYPVTPVKDNGEAVQMWTDSKSLEIRLSDELQSRELIADFVDGSGKTLYSVPLSHESEMSIDLAHLNAGIYYCLVRSDAEIIVSNSIALYE